MKIEKVRLWFVPFAVILGLVGIFYTPLTVNAQIDASGTWGTVKWKFEASTETLTFTSEGEIPADDVSRNWYHNLYTEEGEAIKKIIFEQQCVLPANSISLFFGLTGLEEIEGFDKLDASGVTNMNNMFYGCANLKKLSGLESWKVENVTDMTGMFHECSSLENIDALSNWKTSNVMNMSAMFAHCYSLENADALGNWNIENSPLFLSNMFSGCNNLESVSLSSWNTRNVFSGAFISMFDGCSKLKSITLGANSILDSSIVHLPAIDTTMGNYTGEWIGSSTGKIYSSSDDLMTNYNGSQPDTYVWRVVPTYNAGYTFVSGTTGEELPTEVTDLLPSDSADYENDAVVTAIAPKQTTVNASGGTWTFLGWDADSKTVSGDDVIFTGTWTFEASESESPTYNVGYVFESGTSGKSLPVAVTALLPSDTTNYANEAIVTAIVPEQTTINASGGTWTFLNWDADSKTVFGDDVIFTGIWMFEGNEPESPIYNAGYVFESGTSGKALPKAVTDLLPSDPVDYEDDAVVTAAAPSQTTVKVSGGTWTFLGWDANSKTVTGDDVIFTGTWTFEANEPETPDDPNKPDTPSKPVSPSNTDKPSISDKPKHPATQNNQNTPDNQQKTGKVTTEFPKTGDTQLPGLWGIGFLLSGITLLILKIRKRKIG